MGWMSDDAWDEVNRLEIELAKVENERDAYKKALSKVAEPYWELSHDKVRCQRDQYKKLAQKVLEEFAPPYVPEELPEMNNDF